MEVFGVFDRCLVPLVLVLLAFLPSQRIRFSADLDLVLNGLLMEEEFREPKSGKRVAVGLGSCVDVFVDALSFFSDLEVQPPASVIHHDVISSTSDLAETFAYFFEYGAAAERYVSNDVEFQQWLKVAMRQDGSSPVIGGNAPVMANRFAQEGWEVLLGARMKDSIARALHKSVQVTQLINSSSSGLDKDDVHLILEYDLGKEWGTFLSPRANRLIVHNDHSNMELEALNSFASAINSFHPSLVVIGGLQMLDNFPLDVELRTQKLRELRDMLLSLPRSTKVHFEMASFTEEQFMKDILKYIIPHVDSLGMNEQELANLCSLLKYGNITLVTDSVPRVAITLDDTRTLFELLHSEDFSTERHVSRIHVHTLAFQAILVAKHSNWKNINGAVAKASLTAHRHVCASNQIKTEYAKLIMDESFSVSAQQGSQRMPLIESSPISCWNEKNTKICVAPNLVCTAVQQTAGGGDNISAAGLVLQL